MYTQVHYCNSINISSEVDNSNLLSFQPVCMHYKFAIIHTKISQTRSTHPCNPRVSQCCIKLTSNEPLNFSCLLPWSRGAYLPRTTLLSWSFFWLGACLGTSATNLSMSCVACPTIHFYNALFHFNPSHTVKHGSVRHVLNSAYSDIWLLWKISSTQQWYNSRYATLGNSVPF